MYLFIIILSVSSCLFPKTAKQYTDKAGRKLNRLKRGPKIDSLLFKALRLDKNYAEAYILLAANSLRDTMTRIQWFEKQRYYYQKALKIDSLNASYYIYYAQTYKYAIENKDTKGLVHIDSIAVKKAIELYTKAIKLDTLDNHNYTARAECYQYLGDTTKMLLDLKKAASLGNYFAKKWLEQK